MVKFKVIERNVAADKIMKEEVLDLERLLTYILNELEDKVSRDDLCSWRSFSVEVVE
jgi:hypothetical protein